MALVMTEAPVASGCASASHPANQLMAVVSRRMAPKEIPPTRRARAHVLTAVRTQGWGMRSKLTEWCPTVTATPRRRASQRSRAYSPSTPAAPTTASTWRQA
ncbi:MAG: hypothetical protein ACR2MO_01030 [Acidimicrobiales bacterium]